jgi:hypothetical protein
MARGYQCEEGSDFLSILLKVVIHFSLFQRLIGVQDADSCGKSETGETCPAPAARGSRHKPCHPKRQTAPLWLPCLMLVASGRAASTFHAARRLTGSPRKAESCTEIKSGV